MQTLKTRVFALRSEAGYPTDSALAKAMVVSEALISMVQKENGEKGARGIGPEFIRGALAAFPGMTFEDLFYYEDAPETVEAGVGG